MTRNLHTRRAALALLAAPLALSACSSTAVETGRPLGSELDEGGFGDAVRRNIGYHTGELSYAQALGERFAAEVPTTINFAFNSADLDPAARAVLTQQAQFIRNFPEVRFSVYGHTDAVGSTGYNHRLGLRRARAAVNFLVHQGISRNRLQALVSLGETQLIIATDTEERRNRRTVTEVTGFVASHPLVLDGRYAEIVYRAYRTGGGGGAAAPQ